MDTTSLPGRPEEKIKTADPGLELASKARVNWPI
jgi:hypothetical protein